MFEDLKKNLEHEKKIIVDMRSIEISMQNDASNQAFYMNSLAALQQQLKLLNGAVPELLKEGSPIKKVTEVSGGEKNVKKVASKVERPSTVRMSYVSPSTKEKKYITINKSDRRAFLEKLQLSESSLVGLKKIQKEESAANVIKGPSKYAQFSNRFFLKYSEKLSPQFSSLAKDLKKANVRFLLSTYLSMAIMSMAISFVLGFIIFGVMLVFSLANWIYFLVPVGLVGLTMAAFYLYPASEAGSVQKKISQELPFATIHMAAIAGSNLEPTKIFKILAESKEYPNVGIEIRKVIAQTDIYGYDLVTALKNVASRTSNKDLAELFTGLATNIATGGELKNYLGTKSDNFLMDYKLTRQKYADLAGTFMDVYISILIAAPLVLMMMFIVMNVAGLGMGGIGITTLLTLSIIGIVAINIIFLFVLNIKQPNV